MDNLDEKYEDLILSRNERVLKRFIDLEEFYIIKYLKNNVENELFIRFINVEANKFGNQITRLWKFCYKNNLKIKINDQFNTWNSVCIKVTIGQWKKDVDVNVDYFGDTQM